MNPVGRNEPCPCGSGKKYKHCHADETSRGMSKGLMALIIVICAIGAVGVVPKLLEKTEPSSTTQRPAANAPVQAAPRPGPQPPGPVPAGKVWSTEHGHWHDAAPAGSAGAATTTQSPIRIQQSSGAAAPTGNTAPITVNTPQAPNTPQPPGEAPPGKVWSPEHGHWHDAAPAPATKTQ